MALIPKGPWRGHVLVWNRMPVYVDVGSTYAGLPGSAQYWACQAWSIVNPAPNAPAPRFRNFLLPMTPAGNTAPTFAAQVDGANLFCSGHAWSPAGDLVVAGGDRFMWDPATAVITQALGAKWLFLFDPAAPSAAFPGGSGPGGTGSLYPGEVGAWLTAAPPNDKLAVDRYYPTVMLTHRLNRIATFEETMIVAGGSDPHNYNIFPGTIALPGTNLDPRNTYESYIVRANLPSPAPSFLQQDLIGTVREFHGPALGQYPTSGSSWFLEYPRLHLLSDGNVFLSGWEPGGVRWNPEFPATAFPPPPPSGYDYTIGAGASSTVWNQPRNYGSSVFLGRYGVLDNLVLRLGGGGGVPPLAETKSSEVCFAAQLNCPWVSLGNVSGAQTGRAHSNAVVLPDGSVFVVGGNNVVSGVTNYEMETARYTTATGWQLDARSPTVRDYHATMLLLPDGRVLVGGGEARFGPPVGTDYDVYEPRYMQAARPSNWGIQNVFQDAEGTYLLVTNQTGIQVKADVQGIASFDKIVLTAPGSITHHSDMSARYVELQSVAVDSTHRICSLPAETVVPRGYYMMWALDNGGIPSEAIWVRVQ